MISKYYYYYCYYLYESNLSVEKHGVNTVPPRDSCSVLLLRLPRGEGVGRPRGEPQGTAVLGKLDFRFLFL